ncbi:hypothetical protein Esti_006439 [Eimeria stiedai]
MGPDPNPAAGDRSLVEAPSVVGPGRRSQAAAQEEAAVAAQMGTADPRRMREARGLLASLRGSEAGIVSSRGETSSAYAVAAQLRWLALRVRGLEREAAGAESAWIPASPRSPRVSYSAKKEAAAAAAAAGASAAGLSSKLQKLMRKVAVALESLSEEANHAAAESCSWSSAAARQKQQLQRALEENERLLTENQALTDELSECRAKYLNSERQRQQLLNCKQFQEKFLACQRQVGLLQHDLQTLHQTFEALEASHKAQETQLQQNAQTEARLKEALRTTAEQLAQAKQALTVERASARAALMDKMALREEMVLLPQRTLSHGRLFAGQQQQQAQQHQQEQPQDSHTGSSPAISVAATRSAPQPSRSLSVSRHSVLRCHLKTSIVQKLQQQKQQAAPLSPSPAFCCNAREEPREDSKAGEEARSSSKCSSTKCSSSSVAVEQDTAETAASTFMREGPSRSVSLFDELAASAAGSNFLKPSCKAAAALAAAAGDGKGDTSKISGAPLQQQQQAASGASAFTPKRAIPVSRQCKAQNDRSRTSSSCCCCCGGASACTDSRPGGEAFLRGPLMSPLSLEETVNVLLQSACRSWRVAVEVSKGLSFRPYPESLWALLLLSSAAAAAAMAAWVHLGQRRHQTQEGLG